MRIVDLVGQRYGMLKVISRAENKEQPNAQWNCVCDCGTACVVNSACLRRKSTKSCGCLRRSQLKGKVFGMLTVLGPFEVRARGQTYWLCRCACGGDNWVRSGHLTAGVTQSCGCTGPELIRLRATVHGQSNTPTHRTWMSMKARCYNKNTDSYKYYGARGITVCDRWNESFEAFAEDMGERPRGMTIERIDVNGNYEPSNCKWATSVEQARNKTNTRLLTLDGKSRTAIEWAEVLGIPRGTIVSRLLAGLSHKEVLTRPVGKSWKSQR